MRSGLIARLRERGVLRVAASYAVIAWLALQQMKRLRDRQAESRARLPETFRRHGLAWPLESAVP